MIGSRGYGIIFGRFSKPGAWWVVAMAAHGRQVTNDTRPFQTIYAAIGTGISEATAGNIELSRSLHSDYYGSESHRSVKLTFPVAFGNCLPSRRPNPANPCPCKPMLKTAGCHWRHSRDQGQGLGQSRQSLSCFGMTGFPDTGHT